VALAAACPSFEVPGARFRPAMSDILIALIEAGLLLAIGHASRRRVVLLLAALCVGCVAVLRAYPGVLIDPAVLVADAVGIVAGTIVGWGAIRAHEARRDAGAGQYTGLAGAAQRERDEAARGRRVAAVLGLVALVAGGGALYVERERIPAWRATLEAWMAPGASPASVSGRPAPGAASGASSGAASGASPASVAGRPAPGAASAAASAGAGSPGGSSAPSAAGRTAAADRPAMPGGAQSERARGDLRHCLELASQADVLRCASR